MKTKTLVIHPVYPELDKIAECARTIRNGGLVIFPTETVYGIAANLEHAKAMKRLREIKARPEGQPFSVLVGEKSDVEHSARISDTRTYKLIDAYWPGPLTLIVPSHQEGETIGLRMPNNAIALHLIKQALCPVAAPSANTHGKPAPSTFEAALSDLDGCVEVAIDGGPTSVGTESSVVDMTGGDITIVRSGAISESDIVTVANRRSVLFVCTGNSCRSVMAEFCLKALMKDRTDVDIASAGTSVFVSMGASNDTLQVLSTEGIDASAHHSRPVDMVMLKKADMIFVMTRTHREQLIRFAPSIEPKIHFLGELAQGSVGGEIPDPMGRPYEQYQQCLGVIKEAVKKIIDMI